MQLSGYKKIAKFWTKVSSTHWFTSFWRPFLWTLFFVPALACQQQCPISSTPLTSFVGTSFRLIGSTDPQFSTLSNTNFIIMQFGMGFTGTVNRVENNQESQAPALTFVYNVSPNQNLIRLQYSYPSDSSGGMGGGDPSQSGGSTTTGPVINYQYSLSGTNFTLTDEGSGYTYQFTPYIGAISPDQACTFGGTTPATTTTGTSTGSN